MGHTWRNKQEKEALQVAVSYKQICHRLESGELLLFELLVINNETRSISWKHRYTPQLISQIDTDARSHPGRIFNQQIKDHMKFCEENRTFLARSGWDKELKQ